MFISRFVILLFLSLTLIITAFVFFQLEYDEVGRAKMDFYQRSFSKWLWSKHLHTIYKRMWHLFKFNEFDSNLWHHVIILKYNIIIPVKSLIILNTLSVKSLFLNQKFFPFLPFLQGTYRPCARSSLPKRYEESGAPSARCWRSSSPQKAQMAPWRGPKWCEWFCKQLVVEKLCTMGVSDSVGNKLKPQNTEDLLAGKYHQSGHEKDDSKENKQYVACLPPATAVVKHLGRLEGHKRMPCIFD